MKTVPIDIAERLCEQLGRLHTMQPRKRERWMRRHPPELLAHFPSVLRTLAELGILQR